MKASLQPKPMYCSRDYYYSSRFNQQYEKPTPIKSCTFFGNVYTPQGVMPDPKKVEAIKKIQAPQTKQELQSFLGMVNYLAQFIKDMSQLTHNMRLLLKKMLCSNGQKAMRLTFRG